MRPDPEVWKGRSVLITGHTGFKGAWLSLWLSRLGSRVKGLALPPENQSLFSLAACAEHVETCIADVRDLDAVRAYVEATQPNIVFHMAAQSLVRPSYRDPIGTYATNVMGTAHVLDAVRHVGKVEAVVVVTSDKCYENREWNWAYRENEAMGGYDPYSSSKGCAELVTSAYRRSYFSESASGGQGKQCRVASARAGNVIGGGDWSADRLIPDIIRSVSRSASIEIRNPNSIRPWQHVLEPLSGYIRLAERLISSEGEDYAEGWNFGPADEDCKPVSYIVQRLTESWGPGAHWHLSEGAHPHEASFLKVDASKARARLGWERQMTLNRAIEWTAEWYRRQHAGEDAQHLTLEQIARYEELGGAQ